MPPQLHEARAWEEVWHERGAAVREAVLPISAVKPPQLTSSPLPHHAYLLTT
jgi:hypothetical protein